MTIITRRTVLRSSLGFAAAGALARPFIANAAAKTATIWWTQGFVPEEDAAFKRIVEEYQKQSGNSIDFSLIPFAPLMQKIVSAITSGDVPDLISHDINDQVVVPQNAWDDKIVDVSDVIDTQKHKYHPTVYLGTQYYNNTTKKRAGYMIPFKTAVCRSTSGPRWSRRPGSSCPTRRRPGTSSGISSSRCRQSCARRQRNIYSMGLQCTTTGPADGNNMFHHFLIANGGNGIVTKDGKAHLDDPKIKEAVIKSLTYITDAYKGGYVPSGALSWNDADDNNAFHSKLFVMDLDGTISTEVAIKDKAERAEVTTMGLPNKNDGTPMTAELGIGGALSRRARKASTSAKEFMTYLIKPEVINGFLKQGLGRWLPTMPSIVKEDPFWTKENPQVAAYATEGMLSDTVANYPVFNPGYAEVNAQQVWGAAEADIIRNGMTPQAATESAFKKIETILAKYPVVG